jgi:predicted GIY-YIG superfamily endonuclease
MYYVYVLKHANGYYIGCTDNLKERIIRHNDGYVLSTKQYRPLSLKMYFAFKDKYRAFNFEKYLKSGSGRAFTRRHFNDN